MSKFENFKNLSEWYSSYINFRNYMMALEQLRIVSNSDLNWVRYFSNVNPPSKEGEFL